MGQGGGWLWCAAPTGIEREESVSGSGPGVGQATLGALAPRVARRMAALDAHDVVARLWRGDHLLWKLEPSEIPDRLGWLHVVDEMSAVVEDLEHFARAAAADGFVQAVLFGMGGSSMAAGVLAETVGGRRGALRLDVLDTTVPAEVRALRERLDLDRTLFIAASKSGTTVETVAHLAYFWDQAPRGEQFIAITDAGSPLERQAQELGFRRVFLNRPDIGGRYAALSLFGLVPAALMGANPRALLDGAGSMLAACGPDVPLPENPGAWLGVILGTAALSGQDKLTLVLPPSMAPLGAWIEQLVAESTGKDGRGILPVVGEPLGPPEVYGDDRIFVAIGDPAGLAPLEAAGHPSVRLPIAGPSQLGKEFVRWELAVPIAAHLLGVDPFDQPNVEESKQASAQILESGGGTGWAPPEMPTKSLSELLRQLRPSDYIAIQAYLPRTEANAAVLGAARLALRNRFQVATTLGYGPGYLHATGQYHKGGPGNGLFIQVAPDGDVTADLAIPGQRYTFGELTRAQAVGDLQSLQRHDRHVTRVTLSELRGIT